MLVTRFTRVCVAALLAAMPASAYAVTSTGTYSNMFVFGDSLVDAGNIRILTGGATPNPALGYFQGRFTNGFDYTDQLSFGYFGSATRPSLAGGNNFSFGGARIVTNASDAIPDIAGQLASYTARVPGAADPNALFVLNFGGNDVFGLLSNNILPFTDQASYIAAAVSQYAGAVQSLNNMGARNILITGIPNATEPLAYTIDAQLQTALNGLSLNASTSLFRFSYLNFFNQLQADPGSLGLPPLRTDITCIQAGAQATGCQGIFSFDGTHPTAAVQDALFRVISRQVAPNAIPEPATWALMIGGFGLAGAALRRRTRVAFA